jgi:hypothetical protein
LGRFISPDTITPGFNNPQALNRYSYCFNNPLKYNDPTGHWPNWKSIGNAIKATIQTVVNVATDNLGTIQTLLDVAGMIPVVGEVFDVANGIIYAAQGDALNAALSFAACIPVAGNIATGAKLVGKTVDVVPDIVKAVDNTPASLLDGPRDAWVYYGVKDGERKYIGITNDLARREAEHVNDKFDYLDPLNTEPMTRAQARAIEQAGIENNPNFSNIRNSISPNQSWYNEAVSWGNSWLTIYGLK